MSSENRINKLKAQVEITLVSGETFAGSVFVKLDERVSDLLNDHRSFIPISLEDDSVKFVQKSTIADVTQIEEAKRDDKDDSWGKTSTGFRSGEMSADEAMLILNIKGTFKPEDVVHAHRTIMARVHPDMGGSNYMASKVNIAKSLLLRVAKKAMAEQAKAEAGSGSGNPGAGDGAENSGRNGHG